VPTKSNHNIAYLRSGKMPYAKQSVAARVAQVFIELGVQQTRLVMPTRGNLGAYEALVEAATQLVEAKKATDRLEQDVRVARQRLGMRDEGAQAGEGEGVGADGDEDGAPGAQGQRAGSVASSRSVRSRKAVSLRCGPVSRLPG
jgi:DNA methyltransferase 1-associated protein 1